MSSATVLPYAYQVRYTGDLINEENLVEFRLLYQGELLPSPIAATTVPIASEISLAL